MISDDLFQQWTTLAQKSIRLAAEKKYDDAIAELNDFLHDQQDEDLKSEVIALRAEMMERQGRLLEAESDLLIARFLSAPASYRRYTLELMLAGLSNKMGESKVCALWYLQALETVACDPSTSGATAIEGLIAQKGTSCLNPHERDLCIRVLHQAWKLFSLPGEPDIERIYETLRTINTASSKPLPLADRVLLSPSGETTS